PDYGDVNEMLDAGRPSGIQESSGAVAIHRARAGPQILGHEIAAARGGRQRGGVNQRLAAGQRFCNTGTGSKITANPFHVWIRSLGSSEHAYPIGALESRNEVPT